MDRRKISFTCEVKPEVPPTPRQVPRPLCSLRSLRLNELRNLGSGSRGAAWFFTVVGMTSQPAAPVLPASDAPCPCGSGRTFGQCCEPLLREQRPAADAAELMRSRFTA